MAIQDDHRLLKAHSSIKEKWKILILGTKRHLDFQYITEVQRFLSTAAFLDEKKGNHSCDDLSQMPGCQKKGHPVREQPILAAPFEASTEVVQDMGNEAGTKGCQECQEKREKIRT